MHLQKKSIAIKLLLNTDMGCLMLKLHNTTHKAIKSEDLFIISQDFVRLNKHKNHASTFKNKNLPCKMIE